MLFGIYMKTGKIINKRKKTVLFVELEKWLIELGKYE